MRHRARWKLLRPHYAGAAYREALIELGYAAMQVRNSRLGVTVMEEGLELMRPAPMSGFQIGAMRMLALGYARRGQLGVVLDMAIAAHDQAIMIG